MGFKERLLRIWDIIIFFVLICLKCLIDFTEARLMRPELWKEIKALSREISKRDRSEQRSRKNPKRKRKKRR